MRILTLVTGADAVADAVRLTKEIRAFNAGVDFRLRFLHIMIEEEFAAVAGLHESIREEIEHAQVHDVAAAEGLEAAAHLALLFARHRPDLVVAVGTSPILEPVRAAAAATRLRIGYFGGRRGASEGALDLGEDAAAALEHVSRMAGEIR